MTLGAIAVLTVVGRLLPVNATTAGPVYMLTVLVAARFGGLTDAVISSIAAALCLNYFFLPPLFRFTIGDPQDLVAFLVFLASAIMVSKLSSTAKEQTVAALSRGREMEQLYTLSRAVLLNTSADSTAREIAMQIARVFEFTGVSLYESSSEQIHRAGDVDLPEWDDRLRQAALSGTMFSDAPTRTLVTSVRLGADVIGSLAVRGEPVSDSALQALANLVAIALERARMLEASTAADLIRKTEELKSTLLDAIAHEFKTPLTSIKAAASALRSGVADARSRQEMVEIIDEEADRLEQLVTDALQMARMEAGNLRLERQPAPVAEMIASAVDTLAGLLDGRLVEQKTEQGLRADVDPELIQLALKQVLDNALKYSPPGSPIRVSACHQEGDVLIRIANDGPGIPRGEQRRIFDRYYRSPETRNQVSGTGLGLSIAREIVLAHGGRLWAESQAGEGSVFTLLLPSARAEVTA